MAVYVFTGKLGGGKTLCSVGRIKEKLESGCVVATNLDIDLVAMFGRTTRKPQVIRIPDKPKIQDMRDIGKGNLSYDESRNGLIVLDECGTWFNSRNWNDRDRKPVNEWFLHARKLGWDVILIIQDIALLDSQARDALAEHVVFCKRLDRIQIPFVGSLFKAITGRRLSGPRVHVAKCVYGLTERDPVADRWVYRGNDLFRCYDTKQTFLEDYEPKTYSLLTPWHLKGRYAVKHNRDYFMRITRIYLKRFKAPSLLFAGAVLGSCFGMVVAPLLLEGFAPAAIAAIPEIPETELVQDNIEPENNDSFGFGLPDQDQPPTVAERFGGYYVSGYIESARKQIMTITSPDGVTLTTQQVRSLGYVATHGNNCQMRIASREEPTDSTVIFASPCLPITSAEPYQVSDLYNVRKFAG